jgi:hypothetical protein
MTTTIFPLITDPLVSPHSPAKQKASSRPVTAAREVSFRSAGRRICWECKRSFTLFIGPLRSKRMSTNLYYTIDCNQHIGSLLQSTCCNQHIGSLLPKRTFVFRHLLRDTLSAVPDQQFALLDPCLSTYASTRFTRLFVLNSCVYNTSRDICAVSNVSQNV